MIELLWNAPMSERKAAKYIEALQPTSGQRVVDFGCGCGEFLIRLHEQYSIQGIGIDNSTPHIEEAIRRSQTRANGTSPQFICADVGSYEVPPQSIDLALCMGATHAFGLGANAFENAIESIVPLLAEKGQLLIADGYMKQPASAGYREYLGEDMPDELTHAANVMSGQNAGLVALAAWTSSEEEWDDFEWGYQQIIEQQAQDKPGDDEVIAKRDRRRKWMEGYLQWGRETLGYGTYLFQKAGSQ